MSKKERLLTDATSYTDVQLTVLPPAGTMFIIKGETAAVQETIGPKKMRTMYAGERFLLLATRHRKTREPAPPGEEVHPHDYAYEILMSDCSRVSVTGYFMNTFCERIDTP